MREDLGLEMASTRSEGGSGTYNDTGKLASQHLHPASPNCPCALVIWPEVTPAEMLFWQSRPSIGANVET